MSFLKKHTFSSVCGVYFLKQKVMYFFFFEMRTKQTALENQSPNSKASRYPAPFGDGGGPGSRPPSSLRSSSRERQGVNASGKFPAITNASCPRHLRLTASELTFWIQFTRNCGVWPNHPSWYSNHSQFSYNLFFSWSFHVKFLVCAYSAFFLKQGKWQSKTDCAFANCFRVRMLNPSPLM